MNKNKKGISAVVATVLIILITVAAVTIIWSAVIPMIKDNLIGSDDCMKATAEVSIGTEGYTCMANNTAGNISIQVVHGPSDFDMAELQVLVYKGGDSSSRVVPVTNFPGGKFEKNDAKIIYVENISFVNATKIQISPIIKVGNIKKNCGVSQTLDPLPRCGASI